MNTDPTTTSHLDLSLVDIARAFLAEHTPDVDAVRAWARRLLTNLEPVGPVPAIGTTAWVALPDADTRKVAAAIAPALARLVENTPAAVALRLRRELLAENRAVANRLKAASIALSTAQHWTAAARRPSHAELEHRRATTVRRAA